MAARELPLDDFTGWYVATQRPAFDLCRVVLAKVVVVLQVVLHRGFGGKFLGAAFFGTLEYFLFKI